MKLQANPSTKVHSKKRTRRQRLRSISALLIAMLFFNFSVLNSANCITYRDISQTSLAGSPEIVISAEIVEKLKEDPHYLCKLVESSSQKAGSDSLPEDANPHDCDFCYYCLVMLGGMAVHYSFLSLDMQLQLQNKEIPIYNQSVFFQAPRNANTTRAPPFHS